MIQILKQKWGNIIIFIINKLFGKVFENLYEMAKFLEK